MILKKFFLFSLLFVFVASCTDPDESTNLEEYVSSFIKGNDNVIAFGSTNIGQILNKTDYKSVEMLDAIVGSEYTKIDNVIDLTSPTFFVAEGPLALDGSPAMVNMFFKVKNKDSLVVELESRSFDINTVGDITYTEDGDFVMGIQNDVAIVVISNADYEAKEIVQELFKKADGDVSGGTVDEILATNGDLVFGVSIENLYKTSNSDLEKLSEVRLAELKEMAKDSYIQTVFKFEEGSAIVESKNFFSDKLKEQLFFRTDNTKSIFKKLNKGDGIMLAGAAFNLDMNKMEAFYEKYSPETLEALSGQLGIDNGMLSLLGSDNLISKLSDGQGGMSIIGNVDYNTFGVNTFLGATDSGRNVFKWMSHNIPYELEYEYKPDGIYGNSVDMDLSGSVDLPKGCEVFGTKGITAFISFSDIDMEEFNFSGEMKFLEIVDYATFEYGAEGGRLLIKAKNGQENVLNQAMGIFMSEMADKIGAIAI